MRKLAIAVTATPATPAPSFIRHTRATNAETLEHLVHRFLTGRTMPQIVNGVPLDTWLTGLQTDRAEFRSTDTASRLGVGTVPAFVSEVAMTLRTRLQGN